MNLVLSIGGSPRDINDCKPTNGVLKLGAGLSIKLGSKRN
jgi:hypothetical protein